VLGEDYLPVSEAYWLVYPPRSLKHRGLQVFRKWRLAGAAEYCRQMPGLGTADEA
jgi:LysR family glycine cleavage system transcriptional activator